MLSAVNAHCFYVSFLFSLLLLNSLFAVGIPCIFYILLWLKLCMVPNLYLYFIYSFSFFILLLFEAHWIATCMKCATQINMPCLCHWKGMSCHQVGIGQPSVLSSWKVQLETDHRALSWINSMRDKNSRVTRWYLALQPYCFNINHRAGNTNLLADYLSRLPELAVPGEDAISIKHTIYI